MRSGSESGKTEWNAAVRTHAAAATARCTVFIYVDPGCYSQVYCVYIQYVDPGCYCVFTQASG